jgi:DNA-binding Xre family transcriptional regulator
MERIELRVKELAQARNIQNAYQLQQELEVAPMVARRLWNNELKQMDFRTLLTLCRAFNCQPGDLLVYRKDRRK